MRVEQLAPAPVAELGRQLRRADQIREEHGREHAVRLGAVPDAGHELLDLVEHRVLVADPRQVVVARQLDVLRAVDALGEIAGAFDRHGAIAGAVQDERRDAHQRGARGGRRSGRSCASGPRPRRGSRSCGDRSHHQALKAGLSTWLGARAARPTGPPQPPAISCRNASYSSGRRPARGSPAPRSASRRRR